MGYPKKTRVDPYFPDHEGSRNPKLTEIEIEEVAAGYDWAGLAGAMAGGAVARGIFGLVAGAPGFLVGAGAAVGGATFAAGNIASSMAGGGGCDR